MAVQANFGDTRPPQKAKAHMMSPIDRMLLVKKRTSKRSSSPCNRMPQAQTADLPPLPAPSPEPPWRPTRSAPAGTQTLPSWTAIVQEAVATEKQRASALQAELKALKAQLRERDEVIREHEANAATLLEVAAKAAEIRASLQADVDEARRLAAEASTLLDQERCQWQKEKDALRQKGEESSAVGRRGQEDVEYLRSELERCKGDLESSRAECQGIKKKNNSLDAEVATITKERDNLLEQLEAEQEEMMVRVEKMERRLNEKGTAPLGMK